MPVVVMIATSSSSATAANPLNHRSLRVSRHRRTHGDYSPNTESLITFFSNAYTMPVSGRPSKYSRHGRCQRRLCECSDIRAAFAGRPDYTLLSSALQRRGLAPGSGRLLDADPCGVNLAPCHCPNQDQLLSSGGGWVPTAQESVRAARSPHPFGRVADSLAQWKGDLLQVFRPLAAASACSADGGALGPALGSVVPLEGPAAEHRTVLEVPAPRHGSQLLELPPSARRWRELELPVEGRGGRGRWSQQGVQPYRVTEPWVKSPLGHLVICQI